jgi:hypothetical protein
MPTDNATTEEDILAVLRRRLTKVLVGFSREVPEGWHESNLAQERRPDPSEFPLPGLVLFALRNVLGFPWRGPEEKVRWSVFCTFNGALVSFEMRKFGFTICTAKDAEVHLDRLCGQLRVAVKHVEDWLKPVAKEQAAKGNVTIVNRHQEFDTRYRFFRKLANRSYGRADAARGSATSPTG